MTEANISIIVRCFNEEKHIRRLLEGIYSQSRKDIEVIVVDSGSTDRTLSIVRQYPINLIHIPPEKFSFGHALNTGCAQAQGEYLVFISAHCFPVNTSWLDNLVRMFEDPNVALVYGKQVGDDSTRFFEHRIFDRLFPDFPIAAKTDPFCNNANCAIRRDAWEKWPYDEELTGLEDIHWAKRVITKGYVIAYSNEATVIHLHNETPQQRYNRYKREAMALRNIFPESHFSVLDFIWFYSSSCVLDAISAAGKGVFIRKLPEIFKCRWDQFTGTLAGYRFKGILAKEMKIQLFYPGYSQRINGVNVSLSDNDSVKSPNSNRSRPKIVALVPMRADSKRVPNKNFRLFNGKPLYWYILNTLLSCQHIEEVYVNTNSTLLIEEIPRNFDRVRIIQRPADLCTDTVPMNDILLYDVNYVHADWYVQTHATNPLLKSESVSRAIDMLLNSPENDSLFSVTPIQTRFWDRNGFPVNHDPNVLLRTQDLPPLMEENSNIYIFQAETLKKRRNRIGEKPLMFELSREEAWDIDEELDFRIAEFLHSQI